jgi:hypothetical protein
LKIAGLGFPVREHLIFYFSTNESAFVFVGRDPLPEDTKISYDDINLSQKLIIKVKPHSSISPAANEINKLGAESFQQNQLVNRVDEIKMTAPSNPKVQKLVSNVNV